MFSYGFAGDGFAQKTTREQRAELAVSLARESEELKARIAALERQLVAT